MILLFLLQIQLVCNPKYILSVITQNSEVKKLLLIKPRCVYSKKSIQAHNLEFYIGDEKLEIVDTFIYLGINFTNTGN